MTDYPHIITYAQLHDLLRALGFNARATDDGPVYKHKASGALLAFPTLPDAQFVMPHHLVGTRMTLDAFGILEPHEFDARLRQAA